MADVTGPISSMPGSGHHLPEGTMCDMHPDRLAVARIQGETDSMGSEMNDMCQECVTNFHDHKKKARIGKCDWCKSNVTDLRPTRDYDEGMVGPVYDVCGGCIARRDKRIAEELEYMDRRYGPLD
jgi:hypothetical protein